MTQREIKKFTNLLSQAREAALEAERLQSKLLDTIREYGINPDEIKNDCLRYENANNLEEAICCFIAYGECTLSMLIDDIVTAIDARK